MTRPFNRPIFALTALAALTAVSAVQSLSPLNAAAAPASPTAMVAALQASALKGHDTEQPFEVDAGSAEFDEREGLARLEGQVVVTQGNLTLKTEKMVIYYDRDGVRDGANPTIIRIDALEPVTITSPSETVTGQWGVYDVAARLVTLGGSVTLKRENSELKGSLLELNLETGLAKLDSSRLDGEAPERVRGRFTAPPARKRDGADGEGNSR